MNNRTSLLKPLSALMTLKFLLLCGLIAIPFSLKANEAGIDNPCLETGGGWYCSKPGEVDDVSHDGENEYTIQVGGSIDLPGIYATLSPGEKRNNFRCPDTPGYGQGAVEVPYEPESRWSPEIPVTFGEPGVFEFTSQVRGVSTDSVCQDTEWFDGNKIKEML